MTKARRDAIIAGLIEAFGGLENIPVSAVGMAIAVYMKTKKIKRDKVDDLSRLFAKELNQRWAKLPRPRLDYASARQIAGITLAHLDIGYRSQ